MKTLLATGLLANLGVSSQFFWLVAMLVLIVLEVVSVGLITIWFAFGALLALIASYFGLSFVTQVIIFATSSLLLLVFTRPLVQKYIMPHKTKTNANSLIGKRAVVTKAISEHAYGQVKVDGQVWTAKADNELELSKGTEVLIEAIEGVKLVVSASVSPNH